jgi:hypothetical protein
MVPTSGWNGVNKAASVGADERDVKSWRVTKCENITLNSRWHGDMAATATAENLAPSS